MCRQHPREDARVRRNGKVFYILVSPSQFFNSPATTEKYLSYLVMLRSGEEVIGDLFPTGVFGWATLLFEPLLAEPRPGDDTEIKATLQEHSSQSFYLCVGGFGRIITTAPDRSGKVSLQSVRGLA
jgi:hypothetical protein